MNKRLSVTFVTVLLSLCWGTTTWAQAALTIRDIFALRWHGTSIQTADFTESGKVYIDQRLSMTLDDANVARGTVRSTFTLDGVSYRATLDVSGRFDPSSESMSFRASVARGDALPLGLSWCGVSGTMRFYNDADRQGHFILKGTLGVDCGGTADLELIDE